MSTTPPVLGSALRIDDLRVSFLADDGAAVRVVDGVTLDLRPGESLGLVGESGCGKSVTALSVLRLVPCPPGRIDGGRVLLDGQDLLRLPAADLRRVRGARVGMIFQEPATALSPLHTAGSQLVEALQLHRPVSRADARREAEEWLRRVGLPDPRRQMRAWPHELSGGMRQRVMIAMALMLDPRVLIADEPTTALDVTIQAQIFELMRQMRSRDTALLFITHDLGAVWEMCTRVAVMYAGEIVETAGRDELFGAPQHPYTELLLASIPALAANQTRLKTIPGQVPPPSAYPSGCRFRDRCPCAFERCARERPELREHAGREVRCWLRETR